jgi:hypothetical protein
MNQLLPTQLNLGLEVLALLVDCTLGNALKLGFESCN